jgi:hypothetical protein
MGASSLWRNSNLCVFFPEEQFAEKTMCSSHWSSVHLKMLQTKGLHECTVVDRKEQFDCCNFDEKLCEKLEWEGKVMDGRCRGHCGI